MSDQNDKTWAWILLPAFAGILGGVIAYFALKHDDLKYARMALYLGIVMSMAWLPGLLFGAIMGNMSDSMPETVLTDDSFTVPPAEQWPVGEQ